MSALHLVATPIGNLEDVTLRALRVLREASVIYAEDTRRTRVLLAHHDIPTPTRSLHAHNERGRIDEVLARLASGEVVALVSDAGTPLVSDPGERLCAAVAEAGHAVVPIPGASAVLSALAASGLATTPFAFLGFPPRRPTARAREFARWQGRAETLVLFESPKRLAGTLRTLAEALGDRPAAVARELTKLHEEFARGSLSQLAERFAEGARGEVTLVIAGDPGAATPAPELVDARLRDMLAAGSSARDAAAALARELGLPKRDLYARAHVLRAESGEGEA